MSNERRKEKNEGQSVVLPISSNIYPDRQITITKKDNDFRLFFEDPHSDHPVATWSISNQPDFIRNLAAILEGRIKDSTYGNSFSFEFDKSDPEKSIIFRHTGNIAEISCLYGDVESFVESESIQDVINLLKSN